MITIYPTVNESFGVLFFRSNNVKYPENRGQKRLEELSDEEAAQVGVRFESFGGVLFETTADKINWPGGHCGLAWIRM